LDVVGDNILDFRNNIPESNTINDLPILYIDGIIRTCPNNSAFTSGSSYSYLGFVGCFNITIKDSSPTDHILLASTTNSTISNISISFTRIAISLQTGANYNTLANNTANNNSNSGIFISTSSNNILINNIVNNNSAYGVILNSYSNSNTITNNTANDMLMLEIVEFVVEASKI